MSAATDIVPARAPDRAMDWGAALFLLLRRPAAYSWVPLAGFASLVSVWLVAVWLFVIDARPGDGPAAPVYLSFATLIGLLVGQSIRELQHCQFSWGLPGLRKRLMPGAIVLGLVVSLFAREIFALMLRALFVFVELLGGPGDDLFSIWRTFPPFSIGVVAVAFLGYWIGVRPSVANTLGVLLPAMLMSPWLSVLVAPNPLLAAAVTLPLSVFLIHDTFSVTAARQRPFLPTRPLSGVGWSRRAVRARGEQRPAGRRARSARAGSWPTAKLGSSIPRWVRAGWYENHGWEGRLIGTLSVLVPASALAVLAAQLVTTMFAAPELWFTHGYGRLWEIPSSVYMAISSIVIGSTLLGVPLSVYTLAYAGISLRRPVLYPRSRSDQAEFEYWSGLVEAIAVTGFVAAVLFGLWISLVFLDYGVSGFNRWPAQVGSRFGWVLAVLRVLAVVFIAAPITQYYRLRHIRALGARSPVAQLLTVFALAAVIGVGGTMLSMQSLAALERYPLVLHVAVFATAAMIMQYLYRRAVHRHFAMTDLV